MDVSCYLKLRIDVGLVKPPVGSHPLMQCCIAFFSCRSGFELGGKKSWSG